MEHSYTCRIPAIAICGDTDGAKKVSNLLKGQAVVDRKKARVIARNRISEFSLTGTQLERDSKGAFCSP